MNKVVVAMIGCGSIAEYHASHLIEMDDVDVVAVADPISERAEKLAKMFNAQPYRDHQELYDNEPDLEAVYVCIPPYAHTEQTEIPFIRRGCGLYIEKPMALDLALARKVQDEIARAGIVNTVGFQLRYLSFLQHARAFVDTYQPETIYANRIGGLPGVPWFNLMSQSGGQMVEQNIHTIDMLRYILGDVAKVYGVASSNMGKHDMAFDIHSSSSAILTFKSGHIVTVNTGCYIPPAPAKKEGLDLHVEGATAAPDYNHLMMIGAHGVGQCNYFTKFTQWDSNGQCEVFEDASDFGFTADRAFIDAVKSKNPSGVLSPYYDAFKTLQTALAINESFSTGKEVSL